MQVECGIVFRFQPDGGGLESRVESVDARNLDRKKAGLLDYGGVVGDDMRIILAVGLEFDMIQCQRLSIIFGRVPFGRLARLSDGTMNVCIGDMGAHGETGVPAGSCACPLPSMTMMAPFRRGS